MSSVPRGIGVNTDSLVGFDVASGGSGGYSRGGNDNALAALQVNGQSRLYSVDLDSGRARERGRIGNGEAIRDIAIPIGNTLMVVALAAAATVATAVAEFDPRHRPDFHSGKTGAFAA